MALKELAAELSTQTLVGGFRAIRGRVGKRQYKRLLASAVAQLLELHPNLGARKARRRARKVTGARPYKRWLKTASKGALREGVEAAALTAAAAGAAKLVDAIGGKARARAAARQSGAAATPRRES